MKWTSIWVTCIFAFIGILAGSGQSRPLTELEARHGKASEPAPSPFQQPGSKGPMSAAKVSLETIERNSIVGCFGGLDCIPSYSYPELIDATDAGYVKDGDLVIGVYLNSQARAYPLSTLWTHEIANDTVGGVPITVNYCPLAGTALNYKGEIDGKPATFGVSSMLYNNNLILYDHQTRSFWPQMLFTTAWGPMEGSRVELLPVFEMTWKAWRSLFPDTRVVSEKYHMSHYPYGDYYTNHGNLLFPQEVDSRLQAKDLVLGVIGPKSARAYPFKSMGRRTVINDELDGRSILVVFDAEAQTAAAYERPTLYGKPLELRASSESGPFPFELVALEGEGRWDFAGRGVAGKAIGRDLAPVTTAYKGFWFAWSAYYQDIDIFPGSPAKANKEPGEP